MSIHPGNIEPATLATGFVFTEDPRWRDGRLYFSDTIDGRVYAVDENGRSELLATLDEHCSGLGFLPGGDLLIVACESRRLLRHGAAGLTVHADLSAHTPHPLNDMAVDAAGRAYVVELVFDAAEPLKPKPGAMWLVQPDGRAEVATDGLLMGNGTVFSADGRRLITAETLGSRLSVFDVVAEGRLANRAVFAQLPAGYFPDGIALDAAGGVWAACPFEHGVVRVEAGGRITHELALPAGRAAYACMLGGADGRTLFLCTAQTHVPDQALALRSSRIETVRVEVPGAAFSPRNRG